MKLLDCTLRDGGYYTKWNFDHNLVKDYYQAMESVPIDYVEIGYRSPTKDGYLGEFFYCPEYVMQEAKSSMPSKELAIILNEKDIETDDINPLLIPCMDYISLIRIAVNPKNLESAILLAEAIKNLDFKVAFNVMYMSSWMEDKSFMNKLHLVNDLVDYFYMVDSYGGVLPDEMEQIIESVKDKVSVPIGFHGHNNLELALVNSLTALRLGCEIIDSTITGMGRGAGNLKTELALTYLAAKMNMNVSFNEISVVVGQFEEKRKQFGWGTNLPYMISGANSLPQKDVMELISKRRYSVRGIVNSLQNQTSSTVEKIEIPNFVPEKASQKAILIGGGKTATSHLKAIKCVLSTNNEKYCIIHSSTRYTKEYADLEKVDQYYCLVGNEGLRLKKIFDNLSIVRHRCILPPLPRKMGTYIPPEVLPNSYQLNKIEFTEEYQDSPLSIAIQTALDLKVEEIILVGFDGYENMNNRAQYDLSIENQFVLDQALLNHDSIISWTPTNYRHIPEYSIYSLLK